MAFSACFVLPSSGSSDPSIWRPMALRSHRKAWQSSIYLDLMEPGLSVPRFYRKNGGLVRI